MASRTDADPDIATSRAGPIDRAARTNHLSFVILWVNARFHMGEERGM